MENKKNTPLMTENSQFLENIKKKRPNLTKLDIQKLFEQSIELTEVHRKLYEENQKAKKELQKVEQAKAQRQQFISQVEKIVKQKSQELNSKKPQQSSWLAYKLHQKIQDLKLQIQNKQKQIKKLHLSKQNQVLLRKESMAECLKQINQFAESIGVESIDQNTTSQQDFQQIVWMNDYLQTQKQKVQELQGELQQEQRETKRILTAIANKKIELKKIREMEREYLNVQQSYIQQKKKKQQKLYDNKGYLAALIKERDSQYDKFEQLKQKRTKIENQQKLAIEKLKQKLQNLQQIYQSNKNSQHVTKQNTQVSIKQQKTEQWVKRVTIQQVQSIAKNLNYCLALRGITTEKWVQQFFQDKLPSYSIEQLMKKLSLPPFSITNQKQCRLLSRYVVQDNESGMILQDLSASQDAPIIKSILCKLVGTIHVYSEQQVKHYQVELGAKLAKFWSLVEQAIHIKEGVRNIITKEMLEEGFQSAELQLKEEQIKFAILYLFSWSKDINKLELNKLGKLAELGIKFQE